MGLSKYFVDLMHALYFWAVRDDGEGFGNCAKQISAIRNPGTLENLSMETVDDVVSIV